MHVVHVLIVYSYTMVLVLMYVLMAILVIVRPWVVRNVGFLVGFVIRGSVCCVRVLRICIRRSV